jgi:hypothetical protein
MLPLGTAVQKTSARSPYEFICHRILLQNILLNLVEEF